MTKNRKLDPHLPVNHKSRSWDHYLGRLSPDDWESLETLLAKHAPALEKMYGLVQGSVRLISPEKIPYGYNSGRYYCRLSLLASYSAIGTTALLCDLYPARVGLVGCVRRGEVARITLFELPQFSSAFLALNWSIQVLLGKVEWRTELDLIPATGEDEQNGAPD